MICSVNDDNIITCNRPGIRGHVMVDLSENWDNVDYYHFNLSPDYRVDELVYLNIINNGDTLISAEEEITFIPSIFSEMSANVLQFLALSELSKVISYPLEIDEGVVIYPVRDSNPNIRKDAYNLFYNLSKKDVYTAIKSDNQIEEQDKAYYLKYIYDYKKGDFRYRNLGGKYDILDYEYSIKLTYKGKQGVYSKRIGYYIHHGN